MTAALPAMTFLEASSTVLYPGAEGVISSGRLPDAMAGITQCQLRFSDGASANGSLLWVEDNGWLLLVLGYTTGQGRLLPARGWALEQPLENPEGRFRIRSMVPAGPVPVS